MNETMNVILSRRSHRAYEQTPITEEQLRMLLDAALASPSAVNRQPWHFSVVTDQALLNDINEEVRAQMMRKDAQSRSPRFASDTFQVFYHAPTVIFISGEKDFGWTDIDCGIAVQNIALAAESIELGTVILGLPKPAFEGDRAGEFCAKLKIPDTHRFAIAIAVGVPADTKDAHPIKEDRISFIG